MTKQFHFEANLSEQKDSQHVLGGTALVAVCQANWEEAMEVLLEEQANPEPTTTLGSLPLHYPAVNNSVDVRKKLLAHKVESDIGTNDCIDMTELDYTTRRSNEM